MADVKINCPYCDQKLEIPEDLVGQDINCPACNETIEIAEAEVPAESEPAGQPDPGGIMQPCPKCRLSVHRALKRCRHCGAKMEGSDEPAESRGGIGRLLYMLGGLGATLLSGGLVAASVFTQHPGLAFAAYPLCLAAWVVLTLFRLKNVGMRWWWALLGLVPVVNLYVAFRCVACPEGYQDSRRMDLPGRILVGMLILWILSPVIAFFLIGFSTVKALFAPGNLSSEPASEAPAPPPAAEAVVTQHEGLTVENWETGIDAAFIGFESWFGSIQIAGSTVSVAALDGRSPAGSFWGAISRRYAPTVIVMVTPPPAGAPLDLDTTGAKYRYSNGAEKLFPAASDILMAAPGNPAGLTRKYAGPRTIQPGASPQVSVLFTGPGFDWSVIKGVILTINGKPEVITGGVTSVDEKTRLNGVGRGLRDTRGKP